MVLCDFSLKIVQDWTRPVHTGLVRCIPDRTSPVITGQVRYLPVLFPKSVNFCNLCSIHSIPCDWFLLYLSYLRMNPRREKWTKKRQDVAGTSSMRGSSGKALTGRFPHSSHHPSHSSDHE
jgi:hypothetical protein